MNARNRRHRALRARGMVAALVIAVLGGSLLTPTVALADDSADFAIQKEASVAGPHRPGDTFSYTITVTCRSGTADPCYDSVLTDVLPEPLVFDGADPVSVTMSPAGEPRVAVDAAAGSFTLSPRDPGAADGAWSSGGTLQARVYVRVPSDIDGTWNGVTVTNTATIDADNTPPAQASADVTLDVDTTLLAGVRKTVSAGVVPAVPGRAVTWTIAPSNASNQYVDRITVQDPATLPGAFSPHLAVTGIDVTAPPATDTQLVEYYVGGAWTTSAPTPLSLVDGVRATFDGSYAPGAAGEIIIRTVTTDAVAAIPEGDTLSIVNDAVARVVKGSETSAPVVDDATVGVSANRPDVTIAKRFGDASLVSGQSTTATIVATNGIQDVQTLTVAEPSAGRPGFTAQGLAFDGFDADEVEWPVGATAAEITYVYADETCPSPALRTTVADTLPAPAAGCAVEGFVVTFTADGDDIVASAYARIPLRVTALPVTDPVRTSSINHVDVVVENTAGQTGTARDAAAFTIDPLLVETEVSKQIRPSWAWAVAGADASISLTGKVTDASTVGSDYLVISDPADPTTGDGAAFWDAFRPSEVRNTDIPVCTRLTLNYWSEDAGAWTPLPGATGVAGPVEGYSYTIPAALDDIGGIQYVFEPTCQDLLPPGFVVISTLGVDVAVAPPTTTVFTNDIRSEVDNESSLVRRASDTDLDDIELRPMSGDGPDFIDKHWLDDDVAALSGGLRTARLLWSTQGLPLSSMTLTDPATEAEMLDTAQSVYDAFDLVSIAAITPASDPLIAQTRVRRVELRDAAGTWTDITAQACASGCVGAFGGYTLTAAQSASTVGVRIVLEERTAGAGIGSSYDRRPLDLRFRLRDALRSDPSQWVLGDYHSHAFNTADEGLVENSVAAHGVGPGVDHVSRDVDTILIVDRPINPAMTKEFDQEVLGLPDAGTAAADYPLITASLVATNNSAARVASIAISDPAPGQAAPTAYDVLDLHSIDGVTAPAGLALRDGTVVLARPGGDTVHTVAEAQALTPAQLADVVGVTVRFAHADGTPVIGSGASARVDLTWQLREVKRSGGAVTITDAGAPIVNRAEAFLDSPGRITCPGDGCSTGLASDADEFDIVAAEYGVTVSKDVTPAEAFEDRAGEAPQPRRYRTTLSGRPDGTARTTLFTLSDTSATFWNTMDYVSASIRVPRPVNSIALDVLLADDVTLTATGSALETRCDGAAIADDPSCWTLGAWTAVTPGATVSLTLPAGALAADVVGVRLRARQVGAGGQVLQWERPFNPVVPLVVTTDRRDVLRTDPATPVSTTRLAANPGETRAGVISNSVRAYGEGQFGANQTFRGSDAASDSTIVRHRVNSIKVTKDRGAPFADASRDIPYVIRITNTGTWNMTDVSITDRIDTDADGSLLVEPERTGYTFALSGTGVTQADPGFSAALDEDTGILTITPPTGFVFAAGWTLTVHTPLRFRADLTPADIVGNSVTVSADRDFATCESTTTNLQPAANRTNVTDCTASTSVSPLSAATLAMKKYVKGDRAGDPATPAADDLGVYNVTGGAAAACDPQTAGVTVDGYYSYPCAPITRPGGRADWRLDLTNTGNTAAKVVAGIDVLPAVGDHPVVAPGSRQSRFALSFTGDVTTGIDRLADSAHATRTVLLSSRRLSQACNENAIKVHTEKATPATGCDYAWVSRDAATPAQIAAARTMMFVVTFDKTGAPATAGLRPGETLRVSFQTVTPFALPKEAAVPDGLPVAYNSFAAATRSIATTQPERASLVSEPQKVGIATATGQLHLTKDVVAPTFAADVTVPSDYRMLVTCTSGGQSVTLLTAGGADASRPTVPGDGSRFVYNEKTGPVNLPLFAQCAVVEDPVPTGATSSVSPAAAVTAERTFASMTSVWNPYVGDLTGAAVAVTNTFAAGGFTVAKRVTSDAVDQDGEPVVFDETYSFAASCLWHGQQAVAAGDRAFTLSEGESKTFDDIPAGAACVVTETDAGEAASTTVTVTEGSAPARTLTGTEASFTVAAGAEPQVAIVMTNDYAVGELEITKEITGTGAAAWGAGPFTLQVTCVLAIADPVTVYDGSVVVDASHRAATITDLPVGAACTVAETDDGGATESRLDPVDGRVVIASATDPAEVTVTNDFRTGAFEVAKEVAGPGAPVFSDGPFTFSWVCAADGRTLSDGTLTVTGDGTTGPFRSSVVSGIPVGAECTVTETDDGHADATPSPVTVTIADQQAGVETVVTAAFLNRFSAATAVVEKVVDGAAAGEDWATDAVFTVLATCQLDIDGTRYTLHSASYGLRAGEALPLTDAHGDAVLLPHGARCFIEETDAGGASVATMSHASYADAAVVQADGAMQELRLTATNTFDYGSFTIEKTLVGPSAAEASGLTFDVWTRCVFPTTAGAVEGFEDTFRVRGGDVVHVDGLPLGTVCEITETEARGATSTILVGDTAGVLVPFALTPEEPDVAVVVENLFDLGAGDGLAGTGGDGRVLAIIATSALLALMTGGLILVVRRRRRA